ncbi:MAG: hypothetical protein R3D32_07880 [Nitratireductor sp.]
MTITPVVALEAGSQAQIRARQRRSNGQRVGYLLASGQTRAVPCTIRELGDTHAVLTMGGWLGVPEAFSLFVEPDGVCLDCCLLSVKGNSVRVSTSNSRQERRPRFRS